MTIPGLPVWAQPDKPLPPPAPADYIDPPLIQRMSNGRLLVFPMSWDWGQGYSTPAGPWDDATQINQALAQCATNRVLADGTTIQGGAVELVSGGIFQIRSTISCPYVAPIYLIGGGAGVTVLQSYVAGGDCISMFNNYVPTGGSASIKAWGGGVMDMTIDCSNAPGLSVGIHCGDMKLARFTGLAIQYAGIGMWIDNRKFWTEDSFFEAHLLQCASGVLIDASGVGALNTHDNCYYEFGMGGAPGGGGVTMQNGSNAYNSRMIIHGGIKSSGAASGYFLNMSNTGGATFLNGCELIMQVESDGGAATTPGLINLAAGGGIDAHGRLTYHSGPGTVASTINAPFQFWGPISGDPVLQALAASGSSSSGTNRPLSMAIVTGATSITINGILTGVTSGQFVIPPGTSFNFAGTPTVTWVPLSPS